MKKQGLQIINSIKFKDMNKLYEVETYKTCISIDTPIQIGFLFYNMPN